MSWNERDVAHSRRANSEAGFCSGNLIRSGFRGNPEPCQSMAAHKSHKSSNGLELELPPLFPFSSPPERDDPIILRGQIAEKIWLGETYRQET